jgi:hypothetical protein
MEQIQLDLIYGLLRLNSIDEKIFEKKYFERDSLYLHDVEKVFLQNFNRIIILIDRMAREFISGKLLFFEWLESMFFYLISSLSQIDLATSVLKKFFQRIENLFIIYSKKNYFFS